MKRDPIVSIGIPVYNGERYIRSALDSLLDQTFSDFEMIISDNASSDATFDICREYVAKDPRVSVFKHEANIGLIENWRFVVEKARGRYFVWGSDHDLWHPVFLEALVNVLDEYPDVVMAYPHAVAIDAKGERIDIEPPRFETFRKSKLRRVYRACHKLVGAGNMVYGLFRADALRKCGVLPYNAMPDRFLLLEMSVYGAYKQVEKELWYRRYPDPKANPREKGGVPPDLDYYLTRKRAQMFPGGRSPWYSHLPTLAQGLGLIYHLSLRPPSGSYANFYLVPWMAYVHLRHKGHFMKAELALYARRLFGRQVSSSPE